MRAREVLIVGVLVSGCVNDSVAPLPHVVNPEAATVAPSEHNVLSALVTFRARNTDSVAVQVQLKAEPMEARRLTPSFIMSGDSITIPVLGLLPSRQYVFRAIAYANNELVAGDPLEFTTGDLPPDLPSYTVSGSQPSPGFVVFAAGMYGIVIDNTGRVAWYRRFQNGPGLNFVAQPNGRYVARPATPDPTDVEPWVELDPLGNITRLLGCAPGLQPRLHDLIVQPDGSYWIMCDETRTLDLSGVGGVAGARVTGTAVQHMSGDGRVLFHWSPFDHFALTDLDESERAGANVNWTHGNALDFDADGNVIVSFRNLGEITKIDTRSGAVIWRMGGRRNQFTFLDSPAPAFSRQHGARVLGRDGLLLLDNSGDPQESMAERYIVSESGRTARLTQSYRSNPGVITPIGGSVQSLPGGRTLVSFGTAGRVEEYDDAGSLKWRIEGNPGYVFRAQRIQSLYAPGVGTSR
jgi:hypothetical protein